MDRARFGELLSRAEQLKRDAPWPESQAILDELRPDLALASDDQFHTFMMLESRNQALDGKFDASLDTVEALLERDLEPVQRLAAHTRAANVSSVTRRFETTFQHLNAAMDLLEDPTLERQAVNLYSVAAYNYAVVDRPRDALTFARKALDVAMRDAPLRGQCVAYQRLGFVYKRLGDFEAAREQYLNGLEKCIESGDDLLHGTLLYAFGDLLQASGQFEEAGPYLDRAIESMQVQGYRSGLAAARLYRARMALAQDDDQLAGSLLRAALPDLVMTGHDEYVAEAHSGLARLLLQRGRHAEAVDHLLASMEARAAHLEKVHERQSAFLQVQFAVAEKDRELMHLREHQRIAELELQSQAQRSLLLIAVGIGTALLLLLLLALWIRAVLDRRRLRRLAHRDPLTALSNHTRFFELAEKTRQLARDKKRNYTFVLGDIDHFKRVNDEFGHPTGDTVLRQVGQTLREQFSDLGIIGRVGGEEFGLALPGPDHATILRGLEAVRQDLKTLRVADREIPITLSFGVARPRSGESLTALRERADRLLYEAKQSGRDAVVSDRDDD